MKFYAIEGFSTMHGARIIKYDYGVFTSKKQAQEVCDKTNKEWELMNNKVIELQSAYAPYGVWVHEEPRKMTKIPDRIIPADVCRELTFEIDNIVHSINKKLVEHAIADIRELSISIPVDKEYDLDSLKKNLENNGYIIKALKHIFDFGGAKIVLYLYIKW